MARPPRGTGYCKGCGRRILLATNGKLFLHAPRPAKPNEKARSIDQAPRPRCNGSMTREYTPGPDMTYKETP